MKLKIPITCCLKMIVGEKTRNRFFNTNSQEYLSSICIAKVATNSEIKLIRFALLRCCKMQATIVLLPCFCEFKLRRFLKIIELIYCHQGFSRSQFLFGHI